MLTLVAVIDVVLPWNTPWCPSRSISFTFAYQWGRCELITICLSLASICLLVGWMVCRQDYTETNQMDFYVSHEISKKSWNYRCLLQCGLTVIEDTQIKRQSDWGDIVLIYVWITTQWEEAINEWTAHPLTLHHNSFRVQRLMLHLCLSIFWHF